MRLCRVNDLFGKARPRRFGAGAYCAFATIALKRVIGMVLLFGFLFCLLHWFIDFVYYFDLLFFGYIGLLH
jgi:hypothetical protein